MTVIPFSKTAGRGWTQTYTGQQFFHHKPDEHKFILRDIGHQLSQVNRYGGSCKFPYSVAQHSVIMADHMWDQTQNAVLAMDCLFHDASEAYIHDIKKPLKVDLPGYNKIEDNVDRALRQQMAPLGVPSGILRETKVYDKRIIHDEREWVMNPCEHDWCLTEAFPPLGVAIFRVRDFETVRKLWWEAVASYGIQIVGPKAFEKALKELW